MLKFQQNRTQLEIIRILFVTSLDKGRRTDVSVKKIHESWKLNGNIFFELFLRRFRWKYNLGRLQKNETKKKARKCEEPIIYSICGLRHVQVTISALEASLVPNYFQYPYKYPEFHLRKIWPQFWANRHFPEGDGHYGALRTNNFESTWQIEDFSSDHVLIPSNYRRGSKAKRS